MDRQAIQRDYDELHQRVLAVWGESSVSRLSGIWAGGTWAVHLDSMLVRIPVPMAGKVVVDFGTKFGFVSPMIHRMGAARFIGTEGLDRFVEIASGLFPGDTFVKVEDGYVPLQPESVDLVIVNEVISHIALRDLPIVYQEIARILKVGGGVFISDGNNHMCPEYINGHLKNLHHAKEFGPDDGPYGMSFKTQRANMIRKVFPALSAAEIENLALNTAGLDGDRIVATANDYVETGSFIRRPLRKGVTPTYVDSGIVEERPFYPQGVMYELMTHGIRCDDMNAGLPVSANFQIYGTKVS